MLPPLELGLEDRACPRAMSCATAEPERRPGARTRSRSSPASTPWELRPREASDSRPRCRRARTPDRRCHRVLPPRQAEDGRELEPRREHRGVSGQDRRRPRCPARVRRRDHQGRRSLPPDQGDARHDRHVERDSRAERGRDGLGRRLHLDRAAGAGREGGRFPGSPDQAHLRGQLLRPHGLPLPPSQPRHRSRR